MDLALDSVRVQLGHTRPVLDLATLRGRLLATWRAQGWQLAAKRLELRTHSGMQLAPAAQMALF